MAKNKMKAAYKKAATEVKEIKEVQVTAETQAQFINIPGVTPAPAEAPKMRITVQGAAHNPAALEFPTDKWGLTRDVKMSMIQMSARVCGSEEKYKLAMETLGILTQYLTDRYTKDNADRNA